MRKVLTQSEEMGCCPNKNYSQENTMKRYPILLLLLLLSLNVFAQRKALVIGNSSYGKDHISTSLNDAQLAADALKAINYEVTQLQNLDFEAMKTALDNFKGSLRTGDVAVFYYAGYTSQVAGKNYLLPNNSKKQIDERMVGVDVVLEAMSRATHSFMFLENRTLPRSFLRKMCAKDKGLAEIQRLNKNQAFAMASSVGQDLPAQGQRYSIFTYTLFNKMTSDMYNYPDLMLEVQNAVYSYTSKAQKPFWQSTLQAPFTFWEPIQGLKFPFRLPNYRGLDGGGSYNF